MNKSESSLQTERKTMRKLKLYGRKEEEKKGTRHFLATVYIDRNKKVVVGADDPKVKEDLLKAIYWRGKEEEVPVFILKGPAPTEELRRKEQEEGIESIWATGVRPGDPKFLEGLFHGISGFRRKYGDYYILDYDIVEE